MMRLLYAISVLSLGLNYGARRNMRKNKDFSYVVLPRKLQLLLCVNYGRDRIPLHMAIVLVLSTISIVVLAFSVLIKTLLSIDLKVFPVFHLALLFIVALALAIYAAICDLLLRKRNK